MGRLYDINGLKLPSVTTILDVKDKGIGLMKWVAYKGWDESRRIFKESGERGTRIHKYINKRIMGSDEPIELHDEDTPYAVGFDGFYDEVFSKFKVLFGESEKLVWCESCGYAGTLDYFATLKRRRRPRRMVVVDWKTTSKLRDEVAVQLAAYLHAYFTSQGDSCKIANRQANTTESWAVRFGDDGTYEMKRFRNYDDDFACFKHLLGVYKWQESLKQKEKA